MKIVMVGQGAFGRKHLDGLKNIKDVEVASLVGGSKESTETVAKQYGIPHCDDESRPKRSRCRASMPRS